MIDFLCCDNIENPINYRYYSRLRSTTTIFKGTSDSQLPQIPKKDDKNYTSGRMMGSHCLSDDSHEEMAFAKYCSACCVSLDHSYHPNQSAGRKRQRPTQRFAYYDYLCSPCEKHRAVQVSNTSSGWFSQSTKQRMVLLQSNYRLQRSTLQLPLRTFISFLLSIILLYSCYDCHAFHSSGSFLETQSYQSRLAVMSRGSLRDQRHTKRRNDNQLRLVLSLQSKQTTQTILSKTSTSNASNTSNAEIGSSKANQPYRLGLTPYVVKSEVQEETMAVVPKQSMETLAENDKISQEIVSSTSTMEKTLQEEKKEPTDDTKVQKEQEKDVEKVIRVIKKMDQEKQSSNEEEKQGWPFPNISQLFFFRNKSNSMNGQTTAQVNSANENSTKLALTENVDALQNSTQNIITESSNTTNDVPLAELDSTGITSNQNEDTSTLSVMLNQTQKEELEEHETTVSRVTATNSTISGANEKKVHMPPPYPVFTTTGLYMFPAFVSSSNSSSTDSPTGTNPLIEAMSSAGVLPAFSLPSNNTNTTFSSAFYSNLVESMTNYSSYLKDMTTLKNVNPSSTYNATSGNTNPFIMWKPPTIPSIPSDVLESVGSRGRSDKRFLPAKFQNLTANDTVTLADLEQILRWNGYIRQEDVAATVQQQLQQQQQQQPKQRRNPKHHDRNQPQRQNSQTAILNPTQNEPQSSSTTSGPFGSAEEGRIEDVVWNQWEKTVENDPNTNRWNKGTGSGGSSKSPTSSTKFTESEMDPSGKQEKRSKKTVAFPQPSVLKYRDLQKGTTVSGAVFGLIIGTTILPNLWLIGAIAGGMYGYDVSNYDKQQQLQRQSDETDDPVIVAALARRKRRSDTAIARFLKQNGRRLAKFYLKVYDYVQAMWFLYKTGQLSYEYYKRYAVMDEKFQIQARIDAWNAKFQQGKVKFDAWERENEIGRTALAALRTLWLVEEQSYKKAVESATSGSGGSGVAGNIGPGGNVVGIGVASGLGGSGGLIRRKSRYRIIQYIYSAWYWIRRQLGALFGVGGMARWKEFWKGVSVDVKDSASIGGWDALRTRFGAILASVVAINLLGALFAISTNFVAIMAVALGAIWPTWISELFGRIQSLLDDTRARGRGENIFGSSYANRYDYNKLSPLERRWAMSQFSSGEDGRRQRRMTNAARLLGRYDKENYHFFKRRDGKKRYYRTGRSWFRSYDDNEKKQLLSSSPASSASTLGWPMNVLLAPSASLDGSGMTMDSMSLARNKKEKDSKKRRQQQSRRRDQNNQWGLLSFFFS